MQGHRMKWTMFREHVSTEDYYTKSWLLCVERFCAPNAVICHIVTLNYLHITMA